MVNYDQNQKGFNSNNTCLYQLNDRWILLPLIILLILRKIIYNQCFFHIKDSRSRFYHQNHISFLKRIKTLEDPFKTWKNNEKRNKEVSFNIKNKSIFFFVELKTFSNPLIIVDSSWKTIFCLEMRY